MKHTKKLLSQTHGNPDLRPVGRRQSAEIRRGAILVFLKPVLLAACVLLIAGAWEAQAQVPTANPPALMTYQGYLVDANGAPLATNAPQNYDVIFRIYTASQGGSDLWSEQQTVTVDKGYFSVLLGQGSQYNGEPHTNLAGLFAASDASDRYVQITVKGIGSGGSDVDILPRLRLLTSPYSFLAQNAVNASSLVNNSNQTILSASGTTLTVNGNVTANNIAAGDGSYSGNFALNGNIYMNNGAQLLARNNSGNYEGFLWPRWSDNASYLNFGTGGFHIRNNASAEVMFMSNGGNVGIGTTTPGFPMTFQNSLGDKISLWGQSGNSYGFGIQGALLQIHTDSSSGDIAFGYGSSANMTETVRIKGNGNVGIGTTSPAARLHVTSAGYPVALIDGSGSVGTWLDLHNSTANSTYWHIISTGSGNGEGPGKLLFTGGAYPNIVNSEPLVLTSSGVGIGTSNPTRAALEVDASAGFAVSNYGYLASGGPGHISGGSGVNDFSIYAQYRIATSEVDAFSDARIKKIIGLSNSRQDLKTLLGIQVTDYTMVDTVANGNRPFKKVIAQQVEKVYPQAVSRSTNVVPDIYTKSEAKAGWIPLTKHLHPALKVGDQVRLITEKNTSLHKVTEVKADGFRVKDPLDGPVFVYGRQVNDFRTVDYDAISMLNVSATQELYHELQAKDAEISRLRQRVDVLAAREKAQAVRFDKLETLVNRMRPAVRTASLH